MLKSFKFIVPVNNIFKLQHNNLDSYYSLNLEYPIPIMSKCVPTLINNLSYKCIML